MKDAKLKAGDWAVRIKVFEQLARNDNISAVIRDFEGNAGNEGYPKHVPDRATISKYRKELLNMIPELVRTLPLEVQAFVISKKPDMKSQLASLAKGNNIPLQSHIHSSDPLNLQAKKEHHKELVKIAKLLLEDDVGKIIIVPNEIEHAHTTYTVASDKSGYYDMTRDELIKRIEGNIDAVVARYNSSLIYDRLQPHIIAEAKVQNMDYDNFYDFLNRNPGRLVYLLRIVGSGTSLKGTCPTCPICKDWQ